MKLGSINKKRIVYKLITTFISIIGVVLILVGIVLSIWFNSQYEEAKTKTLDKQTIFMKAAAIDYLKNKGDYSTDELKKVMYIIKDSTQMDTLLIDKAGYIYCVSNSELEKYKFTKANINEDSVVGLKNKNNKRTTIKFEDGTLHYVYLTPIYLEDAYSGTIIMIGDADNIKTPIGIYMVIWGIIITAIIISSIVLYYFSEKVLVKPLEQINTAARKLAKGDTSKRVNITSQDEIGELAESFNIMAESLENVDKNRKEFVSNISHELRSPITSIKGFIAGILDGIVPNDKEHFYLKLVYDEIDRLTRLVNDLLDISSLESGKFKLTLSEFDINELIRLCILNLESKINEKGLKVKVVFEEGRQYVEGDRDRIIQVITNLIENAIKYSSRNGKLEINTFSRGESILVSVYNDGPIIPKEDINNIWDRFYKIDKSRSNKLSMGLGLPIVRLILTQHEQDIWVKNIDNKGVEFIFTLKRS